MYDDKGAYILKETQTKILQTLYFKFSINDTISGLCKISIENAHFNLITLLMK